MSIQLHLTFLHFPSLRRWVLQRLVLLFPLLCMLAAAGFFAETLFFQNKARHAQGEVISVYEREGDNPMERGKTLYSPVFRYVWSNGEPTQASTGQAHATAFKVGEKHPILYDPGVKTDVRLTSYEQLWALPVMLLTIGLVTFVPALALWIWAIRPRIKRPREQRLFCLPAWD